jgi:uncharacterized tellurite resistance protein B-like protein
VPLPATNRAGLIAAAARAFAPSSQPAQRDADLIRLHRRAVGAPIAATKFPTHIRSTGFHDLAGKLMLDGLRQFIADIVSPNADADMSFDDSGYLLAATALLVHVVSLDGEPSATEKRKLHSLIESRFKLDPGKADHLIARATRAEGDAVDLYHFTSVIMRSVNEEGRLRIIEMMWEMVYADGEVTEFEDNVLWRAGDLLGVSSRDRIDLKRKVAEQRQPGVSLPNTADAET